MTLCGARWLSSTRRCQTNFLILFFPKVPIELNLQHASPAQTKLLAGPNILFLHARIVWIDIDEGSIGGMLYAGIGVHFRYDPSLRGVETEWFHTSKYLPSSAQNNLRNIYNSFKFPYDFCESNVFSFMQGTHLHPHPPHIAWCSHLK